MRNQELKIGLKNREDKIVGYNDTAKFYASGSIEVFATPAMIALMEKAALNCVQAYLQNGFTTVGTQVNVNHINASLMNSPVYAIAELIEIDDKKLTFKIEAFDLKGIIGSGTHKRYIVNIEQFMNKIEER